MEPAWWNNRRSLSRRLASGERRCTAYGFVMPENVQPEVLADKLAQRERMTGVLRCYLCGRPVQQPEQPWHLDHVRPLVKGYRHEIRNLEAVNAKCNLVKGDLEIYDREPTEEDLFGKPFEPFRDLRDRIASMSFEAILEEDDRLARKVISSPRDLPATLPIWELEYDIAEVLGRELDPYVALSTDDIFKRLPASGPRRSKGVINAFWYTLMGLHKDARGEYAGAKAVSSVIVPVRLRRWTTDWGIIAFRLRFSATVIATPDTVSVVAADVERGSALGLDTFPEHDGWRPLT